MNDLKHNLIKFSIIFPCYNVASYIIRCIDSVMASDPYDSELIFINDGSVDNTANMIYNYFGQSYQHETSTTFIYKSISITIINQSNSGVSYARNQGILIAKGEYLIFIDPDDYIDKSYFSTIRNLLKDSPDILIMGFKKFNENKDGNVLGIKQHVPLLKHNISARSDAISIVFPLYFGYSVDNIRLWTDDNINLPTQLEFGSVWRNVYKKELISSNNIRFNEKIILNEDSMFNSQCICYATNIKRTDYAGYNYIVRQTGALVSVMSANKEIVRLIRNKRMLVRERGELVKCVNRQGYRQYSVSDYAGSNVLSVIELMVKTPLKYWKYLKKYIDNDKVKESISIMPFTKSIKFNGLLCFLKIHLFYPLFILLKFIQLLGIDISV